MSDVIEDRLRAAAARAVEGLTLDDPRAQDGGPGVDRPAQGRVLRATSRWRRPVLLVAVLVALLVVGGVVLVRRDDLVRTVDRTTTAVPTTAVPTTDVSTSTTIVTTPDAVAARLVAAVQAMWSAPSWTGVTLAEDGHVVQRLSFHDDTLDTEPVEPAGPALEQSLGSLVQGPGGELVPSVDEPTGTLALRSRSAWPARCVTESQRTFTTWPQACLPAGAFGPNIPADSVVAVRVDDAGRIVSTSAWFHGRSVTTTITYPAGGT